MQKKGALPSTKELFGPAFVFEEISGDTIMRQVILLAAASILVSGCGTTTGDRGLSGASIGAGIGVIGGPPGMVVGGVVGAGVGMLSSPRQIDLGRPPWKN